MTSLVLLLVLMGGPSQDAQARVPVPLLQRLAGHPENVPSEAEAMSLCHGRMDTLAGYVWSTTNTWEGGYVVFCVPTLFIFPGNAGASFELFDAEGKRISSWPFGIGHRLHLGAAAMSYSQELRTDVISLETPPQVNGEPIGKQYFAFSGDHLRFVRIEDESGRLFRNTYAWPTYTLGIAPAAEDPAEWINLLRSENKADVLAVLLFWGGEHESPSNPSPIHPERSSYAKLAWELRGNQEVLSLVQRYNQSSSEWIRQAAALAAEQLRSTSPATSPMLLGTADAIAQPSKESPGIIEARALLKEASQAVQRIPSDRQAAAASNIAGQQVRAGDLAGGLATARAFAGAPFGTFTGVLYQLAAEGRLPLALQIIAEVHVGDEKAVAYLTIVGALLERGALKDALAVAHLIAHERNASDRLLDGLIRIYSAQKKAGDETGASATLKEALDVADRAPTFPPGISRPQPIEWVAARRPRMYVQIEHALALARDHPAALEIVQRVSRMAEQEPEGEGRNGILGELAVAKAYVGDFESALRIAASVKLIFKEPMLEAIANEQARTGHAADALATAARVGSSRGLSMRLSISRTLVQSGNYASARQAVDELQNPMERAYGLAQLAYDEVDGAPKEAASTANLAWLTARTSGQQASSYLFQNVVEFVATTRARLGDVAGALEIINGPDLIRKTWPLDNLIQKMVETHKKNEAIALARSQKDPENLADSLLWVARTLMDQIDARDKTTPKDSTR